MKNSSFIRLSVFITACFVYSASTCKAEKKYQILKKDIIKTDKGRIMLYPIKHATFVIKTGNKTIFVDPVGNSGSYTKFDRPDLILLTDIHFDHLNINTINSLKKKDTLIVGPKAVSKKISNVTIINNGETGLYKGFKISAVAMYNTTTERYKFHPKGRGNGYIITIDNKRIYISGDTEDIPEMRSLKDIDAAFICMNMPYTMTVEQAASAVLEFKPKIVYPYHYRGANNKFSNLKKFKRLVSKNKNIDVRFLKWY